MNLYMKYFLIHLKSQMQYKASFFLACISQLAVSFAVFLEVLFMFYKVHQVEGFTFENVLIAFAVILMAFALAECFARGFDLFPQMIANGEFDRILVRPVNEVYQILLMKMEFSRLGRFIQALAILIYAFFKSGVNWDLSKVILIILMISCGAVLFFALFWVGASAAFFTIDGIEFMNIFTDGAREFGRYPFSIYGGKILFVLTYIIPLALVQYYPLLYLLDMDKSILNYLAPLLSLLFLIPASVLWFFAKKRYVSTGS